MSADSEAKTGKKMEGLGSTPAIPLDFKSSNWWSILGEQRCNLNALTSGDSLNKVQSQ